jgi:hypothetical protein
MELFINVMGGFAHWIDSLAPPAVHEWLHESGINPIAMGGFITFIILAFLNSRKN